MCPDNNCPENPQSPCTNCGQGIEPCLDCVQQQANVVEVEPRPNYCAEIVDFLAELEQAQNPCTLQITSVGRQADKAFVVILGAQGTIEYSDNGVLWQLSPVFDIPQIDGLVVYFAREKARPACVASKTITYDEDGPNECVPLWRDTNPLFTICIDQVRHKKQVDGCGGERFVEVLNDWTPTGRSRCSETCTPAPVTPTIQTDAVSVCANATVEIEAVGGVGTIKWYSSDNLSASLGQGTVFNAGPGRYKARAESTCGTSVFSNEIVIAQTEVLAPTLSTGSYQLCGAQTTTLTATGGSTGTVKWYKNGIFTNVTGATFNAATAGVYTAIVENGCGISAASTPIGINYVADCGCTPVPTTPQIQADRTVICGSQQATLTATGGNGTYRWFKDGQPTGATTATVQVNLGGTYSVSTVTACGESIVSNFIQISNTGTCLCTPQPTPPTISADNLQICANQTAVLTATGGSGSTVRWYKNGVFTNVTGLFLDANSAGSYTARYQNPCGESGDSNVLNVVYESICEGDVQPNAQVGTIIQPQCVNGILGLAAVSLTSIENVHHYRICVDNSFSCPDNCDTPDGIIGGGETTTTVLIPAAPGGTSRITTIRLYRDSNCAVYKDIFVTITSPVCGQPDGGAVVISQPQCVNGALTQAVVRLIGLQNVDRFIVCRNSTFTCANTCMSPDGNVPSGQSTADILMPAPGQDTSQAVTIRLYRDSNCSVYKDVSVLLVSPNCQCNPQPTTPAIVRVINDSSTTTQVSSVCGSETAVLQASGCNGIVRWYRSNDLSTQIGGGSSIQVGSGSYVAKCETTCGASDISNEIVITNSGPCGGGCQAQAPQIFGSGTVCAGGTVTLQAVASCLGGTIRWRKDNVTLQFTGNTLIVSNVNSGNVGAYKAVCDLGNGCISPESNAITVSIQNTAPNAPTISADLLNPCGDTSATLEAAGVIGTLTWYRNGVATGLTGAEINTQISGVYTARNSNNCGSSADSNAITIAYQPDCECTPAPSVPSVSPSTATICGSQTTLLSATGGNGTYRWYRNGIFTGLTGPTFTANQGGSYTATTLNSCGESTASAAAVITYQASCGGSSPIPSASLGTILPPQCSGTQLIGAFSVTLNNVLNADRYEYCFSSSFTCTPNCLVPDGTLTAGTNIISLPAPAQGVSQPVTIRIYNGTNCNSYLDIPVTLNSPNCQSLCALSLTNSGGVGIYDSTYIAAQTGTFYWRFDDASVADNLKIYRNGNLVHDSGYASGLKVGALSIATGDLVRIVINATVSTVNGQAPNTSTVWEFQGNCSSAYAPSDCTTPTSAGNQLVPCKTHLVETAIGCLEGQGTLRVRARIMFRNFSTGNYLHDSLRFSIEGIGSGITQYAPSFVSGVTATDYAEYTFTGLAPGMYTIYTTCTASLSQNRSFAQINVPSCNT